MAASKRGRKGASTRKRKADEPDASQANEKESPDIGKPLQAKAEAEPQESLIALHRARFVDWQPSAVTALAVSGDGSVLAAARESGAVELWDTEHWSCLTTLAGHKDLSLTSLAWLRDEVTKAWRLFSGGLDGSLTEWAMAARRPKCRTDALGGAIWALAVRPPADGEPPGPLAVACDDGCLRLFRVEVEGSGLAYEASLPPLRHKLLSTAWHPDGRIVIAGTADGSLHAWDVRTRQEVMRVHAGSAVGPGKRGRQPVWAVIVLSDGTLATGDGGGAVRLWDAAHGAQLGSHTPHAAAVLTLAADPNGSGLVSGGADAQIAAFGRVEADGALPMRWEYLSSKRPHTHDIRAMAVVSPPGRDPLVVTGGNDARLLATEIRQFAKGHSVRLTLAPEAPRIQTASPAGGRPLLLASHRGDCDLWRLGSSLLDQRLGKSEGERVGVHAMPDHLARLTLADGSCLLAAALSPSGELVALADSAGVYLYRVETAGGSEPVVERQRVGLGLGSDVTALAFAGERLLLAAAPDGVAALDTASPGKVRRIRLPPGRAAGAVSACSEAATANLGLAVSGDGRLAAVLRPAEMQVLDLDRSTHLGTIRPPEGSGPFTATAFTPDGAAIAAATADSALDLYDVESQRRIGLQDGMRSPLAARLAALPGCISGITFLPSVKRKAALISTPAGTCFVDFGAALKPWRRPREANGRHPSRGWSEAAGANGRVTRLAGICLACEFLAADAVLLVERDWSGVSDVFPPPIYRHRYGS